MRFLFFSYRNNLCEELFTKEYIPSQGKRSLLNLSSLKEKSIHLNHFQKKFVPSLFFAIFLFLERKESRMKKKKLRFQLCLTVVLPANKNRKYLFAVRKSYANECRPIPSKAKRSSNSKSSLHQRQYRTLRRGDHEQKSYFSDICGRAHTHTHIYIENSNMLDKIIRYKKFLRNVTGGIFSSLSSIHQHLQ